jgi:GNAT superfamily N-acetyltransferase
MKWETSNKDALTRTREEYPNVSSKDKLLLDIYCFQCMNLFELCIYHKNRRIFPDTVFGSWLVWMHSVSHEPEFAAFWSKNKFNYIPECRIIMSCAVEQTWDGFIKEMCCNYKKYKKYRTGKYSKLKLEDWMDSVQKNSSSVKQLSGSTSNTNIEIKKGKLTNIEEYLSIFDECKHNNYISHGEIIYGRASSGFKWADDIITQMRQEFNYYISNNNYIVLEIIIESKLSGFAILELHKKTKTAILSDIMIKKDFQGKGAGTKALNKIEEHLKNENIGMVLLESGIRNKAAHDFFEKNGYTQISVEFAKRLD